MGFDKIEINLVLIIFYDVNVLRCVSVATVAPPAPCMVTQMRSSTMVVSGQGRSLTAVLTLLVGTKGEALVIVWCSFISLIAGNGCILPHHSPPPPPLE